ncbi:MAG: hypothetical protein ACLQDF_03755, partial [Desulfomonilia bacterium]
MHNLTGVQAGNGHAHVVLRGASSCEIIHPSFDISRDTHDTVGYGLDDAAAPALNDKVGIICDDVIF